MLVYNVDILIMKYEFIDYMMFFSDNSNSIRSCLNWLNKTREITLGTEHAVVVWFNGLLYRSQTGSVVYTW